MSSIASIFAKMPEGYIVGSVTAPRTYYFSLGDDRYTVFLTPEACRVEPGKAVENADCVVKTTPKLFERMVIQGKAPGALDIARGKFKTNAVKLLQELKGCFRSLS